MTESSAVGQLTHGFLFSDLRGFTAYAEARGDAAAADLLDRYRALVRAVIDELGGAEIKTEGDSFYVVFPSASRAVAAGLAIVAAASRATDEEPNQPIRVGIGINAGEAEERPEGYVGTAVNLAARVCARSTSRRSFNTCPSLRSLLLSVLVSMSLRLPAMSHLMRLRRRKWQLQRACPTAPNRIRSTNSVSRSVISR